MSSFASGPNLKAGYCQELTDSWMLVCTSEPYAKGTFSNNVLILKSKQYKKPTQQKNDHQCKLTCHGRTDRKHPQTQPHIPGHDMYNGA